MKKQDLSTIMRRAWHIARATGKAFAVCLSKAWQLYRLTKRTIGRFSIIAVMTASFSLRQALRRQAEKVIEALARFRYQALRMIFDLL